MKQVGNRREPVLSMRANGNLLAEGARFSEVVARLSSAQFMPKGLYRYRTHAQANQHEQDCLVHMMAQRAVNRHG